MNLAKQYNFLIINGPNLGYIGVRQPEIYGDKTINQVPDLVERLLGKKSAELQLHFYQSNREGSLIDRIERARIEGVDGIVLNAGAYTHTSLALADCLAWVEIPTVEVHLSNIMARDENMRRIDLIGQHVIGIIAGFGIMSYALGVQALYEYLEGLGS